MAVETAGQWRSAKCSPAQRRHQDAFLWSPTFVNTQCGAVFAQANTWPQATESRFQPPFTPAHGNLRL